jgi:hypothetical protein
MTVCEALFWLDDCLFTTYIPLNVHELPGNSCSISIFAKGHHIRYIYLRKHLKSQ